MFFSDILFPMSDKKDLIKALGLYTTIAIVVGAVIGSGIFKKPSVMAMYLGSPELVMLIWIVAGLITLAGALTNAEIAGMITETGGQYVYFRKMYGDLTAYLYGWSLLAVIQTASIASIAYVFAEYSEYFFQLPRFAAEIENNFKLYMPFVGVIYPLKNVGVKMLTSGVIIFLTIANYFGIKNGGRIADIFTTTKVLAILLLIFAGFVFGNGTTENLTNDIPNFSFAGLGILGGVVAALSAAFWAYDGWNNVTYIAGEVKNPAKNIPMALTIGTLIVIGVYILTNLSVFYVLPIEIAAQSHLVAADAAERALGPIAAGVVTALVMISTFGTANGTIMVSARVYFAMARRKVFFSGLGQVHEKYRTPANALILQCIWSCAFVFSGSFDDLTDMLIFVSWIFYGLGAYGVFVLRKKMPDVHRPYKVPFYPILPILFVLFSLIFVILTLFNDISNYINGESEMINSVWGLLMVLIGIPIFYYYRKRNKE